MGKHAQQRGAHCTVAPYLTSIIFFPRSNNPPLTPPPTSAPPPLPPPPLSLSRLHPYAWLPCGRSVSAYTHTLNTSQG